MDADINYLKILPKIPLNYSRLFNNWNAISGGDRKKILELFKIFMYNTRSITDERIYISFCAIENIYLLVDWSNKML